MPNNTIWLPVSWIQHNVLRSFMFIFRVQRGRVGLRLIPDSLGQGVGVGRAVSKNFAVSRWMMIGMDWMLKSVVQMGGGATSGIITGDSHTFGLDNLESEVAGERQLHHLLHNTTLITLYWTVISAAYINGNAKCIVI